jgi:PKD repeat protein
MKKKLLAVTLLLCSVLTAYAQLTNTSATYTAGVQEVERIFAGGIDTSDESFCVDTLIVTIPNGNYIYGVDIEYSLEAFGTVWTSDLWAYVELASEGKKEWAAYQGQYNFDTTETFSRSGLTFANGTVSNGQLKFVLHAFRTFSGAACDTTNALVVDSTFKITVSHGLPPTCFPPGNPTANWVMSDKAELSWTSGGATNWQIEYGTAGFTPGNGTLVNAGSNPFVLTGLTPNTAYDFYVRDSCGVGDVSSWSLAGSFATICTPLAAPYTESFDGLAWSEGTGGANVGNTIDTCWQRNPQPVGGFGGLFAWGTGTGTTPTANSGPATDNSGTGNYVYTEASAGAYQDVALLTSPLVDLNSLTTPELEFYYHMFGGSIGQLNVEIWSQSTGWQLVFTESGQQQDSSAQAWIKESITLNNYIDDTVQVRFRVIRSFAAQGDIAIDDVALQEAPSCPKPSNLVGLGFFPGGATIGWTAATATNWDVQYGLTTFGLGSGTTLNTGVNPTTISGLTPGATYDFYVRERCSATDTSDWIGPLTISIPCLAIQAPFFEHFDSIPFIAGTGVYNLGDTLETCFLRAPLAGTNAGDPYFWGVRSDEPTTPGTGPTADKSGVGNFMYTESSAGTPGQSAVFSIPTLDLSPLTNPELRFWYHMFGASMGSIAIDIYRFPGTLTPNIYSITGPQNTSAASAWQEAIVDLSAFAGDTVLIIFRATRGTANTGDIAIDEISVQEAPTCPEPTNLSSNTITSNSVDLSWVTGGATNWNIAFGAPGFTPGGTFTAAGTNPFTLTGLTPGTAYDIYVRDSCGTGDVSTWVGPISIFTLCAPAVAPYVENFDGTTWIVDGTFDPGAIDPCWLRTDTTTYWWKPRSGATPTAQTGPSSDHTTGFGKYAYTETNGGGNTTTLTSPLIDLSPLTVPELTFWYHMYGSLINELEIQINSGGSWTNLTTLTGQQQTSNSDPWLEETIDLSAYANDTVQIRFIGRRNPGFVNRVDIAIDDFDVHETPTCPKPTNISTGTVTATSIQVAWTTGGASNWNIEYGPVGFTPGSGTFVSATTNPFVVTGLTPNTTYDFYVRDSCGPGNVSTWEGPVDDTTLCGVFTAPYVEDFDGPTWIPGTGGFAAGTIDQCWTRSASTQYWWRPGSGGTPTPQTGPSGDHTSGSGGYVYTESFNGSTNTSLTSPEIDLDTLSAPELRFWYHMYGFMINDLTVEINDGSGWTIIDTIIGEQQTSQNAPWLERIVDISNYAGDTIQLRFTGDKQAGNQNRADISIDDVSINNAPSCTQPSNVQATASTTTSVTLNWTTGGATNWQIEYGPVGFTPGSGTVVVAGTNPFTVTGLSPSQNYDFYVRDSCGVGDVSFWTGPVQFATLCGTVLAPYYENFDVDFNEGTGVLNDSSTISPCWTRNPDSAYHWGGGTGGTGTFGTGPTVDHTSGFGNYVYAEASLTPNGSEATLETPSIDLSPLTSPEMHFWYHMWAANGTQGTLTWEVFSNNNWIVIDSLAGDQGNNWQELVVDLSAYANQTVKIRFKGRKGNGPTPQQGDIAIDDLSIIEAPTCPDPGQLTATTLTLTSIELSWTSGGASAWQIEYGPSGFTPGSGTVVSATTNPFTISGLMQNTNYDFYVRDSCGVNDFSNWVGPISETTFNCVNGCTYELELTDTFGDGWTGNFPGTIFHELAVTVGTTTTSYTMLSGFDTIIPLNVCDSDTLIFNFAANGQWSNECGVILRDPTGSVVFQNSGPMNPGQIYAGSAACNNPCPTPVADFNFNANFLTVDFDATASAGNGISYDWDFGDGTTSTGSTPIHTYANDGQYIVTLIVTDICNQTDTLIDTLTVCGPLVANYSWSQNGLSLTTDASALTNATSFTWQWGDGATDTGSIATHTYATTGTYQVRLVVTNLCGETADTTIFITICVKPVANWTYNIISSGANGMTVQFDATASFGATTYFWDFGDGNTNNTSAFPVHTYTTPGLFWVVTLIVNNDCNDDDTLQSSLAQINLDENALGFIEMYPNPTSTELNLDVPLALQSELLGIRIVDGRGSMLYERTLENEAQHRIDVSHWPAGSYIVEIRNSTGIVRKQLVITR